MILLLLGPQSLLQNLHKNHAIYFSRPQGCQVINYGKASERWLMMIESMMHAGQENIFFFSESNVKETGKNRYFWREV